MVLKQRGQALVEMILVAPLMIAIAAGIMAIAMYLHTKSTTVTKARFAAWVSIINKKVFVQKFNGLDIKPLADYITAANESIYSGIQSRMGAQSELLTWIPFIGAALLARNPTLDTTPVSLPFTRVMPKVDGISTEVIQIQCADSFLC